LAAEARNVTPLTLGLLPGPYGDRLQSNEPTAESPRAGAGERGTHRPPASSRGMGRIGR